MASIVGFINNVGCGVEKIEGRWFHPGQDLIGKEQQNDKGRKMASIGFTNIFGYGVEKIEGRQFHPGWHDKGCELVSIGFTNVFGYGIM